MNLGSNPVKTCRVGEGVVATRAKAAWRNRDKRVIAADLGAIKAAKIYAQIIEWLIMEEIRYRTGRLPRRNKKSGTASVVAQMLKRRNSLWMRIAGRNPLNGRKLHRAIPASTLPKNPLRLSMASSSTCPVDGPWYQSGVTTWSEA